MWFNYNNSYIIYINIHPFIKIYFLYRKRSFFI